MEGTYLNVKNFLSKNTLIVPENTDEFLKLYNMASPELIFRVEKLMNPLFQDYTVSFSDETKKLIRFTGGYNSDQDRTVHGIFIFQLKDMYVAYPDRFFLTIEDMVDGNKFKIDHGRVFYSFKEGNTTDIESFISFKELGYKNIGDYESSMKQNTADYFSRITKLADSFPQNIRERYFNPEQNINDAIIREAGLFYHKIKSGNPSYEEIIESFKQGYEDFESYNTSKRFGNLSHAEFSDFRKYADSFNTYEAYLKAKNNSIWTESGIMLFDKLTAIRDKSGYPDLVEALIHYILENYIFEKMSKEAFTNKIRSLISDILNKYGMQENGDLRNYNSLLEPAIADLESRKQLFEYNQSTGVIRIIR